MILNGEINNMQKPKRDTFYSTSPSNCKHNCANSISGILRKISFTMNFHAKQTTNEGLVIQQIYSIYTSMLLCCFNILLNAKPISINYHYLQNNEIEDPTPKNECLLKQY